MDSPPVLTYAPPTPRCRPLHFVLALLIAHWAASYAVALASITYLRFWRRFIANWSDGWILVKWFALQPLTFPVGLGRYCLLVAQGRAPLTAPVVVWTMLYLALLSVIFMAVMRAPWLLRPRVLPNLHPLEPGRNEDNSCKTLGA